MVYAGEVMKNLLLMPTYLFAFKYEYLHVKVAGTKFKSFVMTNSSTLEASTKLVNNYNTSYTNIYLDVKKKEN